jgi:hypothetical protein
MIPYHTILFIWRDRVPKVRVDKSESSKKLPKYHIDTTQLTVHLYDLVSYDFSSQSPRRVFLDLSAPRLMTCILKSFEPSNTHIST